MKSHIGVLFYKLLWSVWRLKPLAAEIFSFLDLHIK
jgi:hypothetical protein